MSQGDLGHKGTPGARLNTVERKRHLARVAELYCKNRYQYEIAAELNVTPQQISYDLKVLQRHWEQSAILNVHEAKLRELAKIDQLERTYYDEWARSRENKETKSAKKKGNGEGKDFKTSQAEIATKQEGRLGDPRYLDGVQWCITKRSELLGLNKAAEDSAEGMRSLAAAIAASYTDMTNATLGQAGQDSDGDTVSDPAISTDAPVDGSTGG